MKKEDVQKMMGEVLETIAYSSFEMNGSMPVDRKCTVSEAMHELGEDVKKIAEKYELMPADKWADFFNRKCDCGDPNHHH
jgi:hypothetical protein